MRCFSFKAHPRHFAYHLPGYRSFHQLLSRVVGCVAVCFGVSGCAVSAAPPPQETVAVPPKKIITIPRPPAKLLAREHAPKCMNATEEPGKTAATQNEEEKGANPAESTPSVEQLTASLNRRERERDCYRDAEHRVRAKLTKLQTSVRETLRAVDELNKSMEE